ncbi:MAG: XRE family transcriptional regulator [Lachnospiraceae bacterium]|nr:helix-turn-helix domain-containing protein [Lachnospiraceae bacterium]
MQRRKNYEYYKEILERLKAYRLSWEISKAEMAKKLGIDRSLYSRIEKGTKAVTSEILIKMYKLGIDIDYLVTGIKSKHTELSSLFEKCEETKKSNFVNIIVAYMNVMLNNDVDKKLYCRKELEILHFNIDKKNGERDGTVWLCIREIHNYTQEQLRKVLDLNIKTYRKIEKGKTMPTLEILMNLYLELGYYPSLVQEIDSNCLLMINNAWMELAEDKQESMRNIAAKTLKELNRI